jgi:hypothetical protein
MPPLVRDADPQRRSARLVARRVVAIEDQHVTHGAPRDARRIEPAVSVQGRQGETTFDEGLAHRAQDVAQQAEHPHRRIAGDGDRQTQHPGELGFDPVEVQRHAGDLAQAQVARAHASGKRAALAEKMRNALGKVRRGETVRHLGIGRIQRLVEGLVGRLPDLRLHHGHRARRHGIGELARVVHHLRHEGFGGARLTRPMRSASAASILRADNSRSSACA